MTALKVLLSVPMYPYTGYGKDGLALIDLFHRAGFDIYLDPDGVAPPISPVAAALLTKPPHGQSFDLQLKQFDPTRLRSSTYEQQRSGLLLGWTMWEWTSLDARVSVETLNRLPEQYAYFDAIACYDRNSERAVGRYVPGQVKVIQAQGGFDANAVRVVERDYSQRPYKFLMYGALTPRKGPWIAIDAFMALKKRRPDLDIELHLKTTEVGLHPQIADSYPGVHIYNGAWSEQQMRELIESSHCLLCPSLGEGKNMAALEFLASGGPCIATNWGGHTVWMSSEFCYPLRCTEVKDKPIFEAMRAEPDMDHLSELMEHVIDNPEEVRQKSLVARRLVPQMFSWETTVQNMFNRLAAEKVRGAQAIADQLRRGLDDHRG